ncbi:MAG: M61 family peptidase, partial [Planctomycetota bacterium]
MPHEAVLDGLAGVVPPASLVEDLGAIVERAAAVFGGKLPYPSYLFLCLFAAEGHGGLEHSDSTVLLMSRTALASPKGYREFLTLAAHELFHAWN